KKIWQNLCRDYLLATGRGPRLPRSLVPPDRQGGRKLLLARLLKKEVSHRQVEITIGVEVADFDRGMVAGPQLERAALELSRRSLLQPADSVEFVLAELIADVGIEERDGDDVQVAVSVHVAGQGPVAAGHVHELMMDPGKSTLVFQPVNGVVRLEI